MAGKYPAYPEYEDSEVKWIGFAPSKWAVIKLKYLICELEAGVSVNAADYPKSDGEFGVLKTSCVYTGKFNPLENKTVFLDEISRVKCPVRFDSIIISRMNTPDLVGAAAYIDAEYDDLYLPDRLWQTTYFDGGNLCSKYLHYFMCLRGFRDQVSGYAEGTSSSMQSISKEDYLSISVLVPPSKEQACIASFLDHETAKIDTLIEKQQQLIKLLKEKRQAVISHAVTKGLNPDAPMRDSGVEWLGEVPAHWNVMPVRHATNEVTVGIVVTPAKYYVDQGVPCFRSLNIKENKLREHEFVYISAESNDGLAKSKIFEGDILIVRTGQPGTAAVVTDQYDGVNCIDLIILRRSRLFRSEYLCYQINSDVCKRQVSSSSGGAIQQHFNVETAKGLYVALPPQEEQELIEKYIDNQCAMYDKLVRNAEDFVALSLERRTALISAAVTGKIDVRSWVAPEQTQNNKEQAA